MFCSLWTSHQACFFVSTRGLLVLSYVGSAQVMRPSGWKGFQLWVTKSGWVPSHGRHGVNKTFDFNFFPRHLFNPCSTSSSSSLQDLVKGMASQNSTWVRTSLNTGISTLVQIQPTEPPLGMHAKFMHTSSCMKPFAAKRWKEYMLKHRWNSYVWYTWFTCTDSLCNTWLVVWIG